jgi:hypothetical protein
VEDRLREKVIPLRASSEEVLKQLLNTKYIDTILKDLSYDHFNHTVTMKYGEYGSNSNDYILIFKDCFTCNFNVWLEGMHSEPPIQKPGDLGFWFHSIDLEDIEINGVKLYKCSMVIPMMDCQITCVSIEIRTPIVN